ncbi:MAG: hypothetical protein AABM29_00155 [Actinomycetota bacterium]
MIARAAALAPLVALLLIAPAAGSTREQREEVAAFDVPPPTVPFRDVVLASPNRAAARATASDTSGQYPVNDAEGRTVTITVSTACTLSCTHANPQSIASFLGTLPHRGEIGLLTVSVVTPSEIDITCGPTALACYFFLQDRMVINGNDSGPMPPDGAFRDFVIAHEYGHHLANHRSNPPLEPTIDYGPKYWATYERVCEGVRDGAYFPGDEGDHYYDNPGEAFAEAFGNLRFPNQVIWNWNHSLKPDSMAFAAIDRDATDPWESRTRVTKRGEVPRRRARRRFAIPLDGTFTLKLSGPFQADLELILRDLSGHTLGRSDGLGSKERVGFTVCGEAAVRAIVKRTGFDDDGRFKLTAIRP